MDSSGDFKVISREEAENAGYVPRVYSQMKYEISSSNPQGDMVVMSLTLTAGEGKTKNCEIAISYTDAQNRQAILSRVQEEIKRYRCELIANDMIGNKGAL